MTLLTAMSAIPERLSDNDIDLARRMIGERKRYIRHQHRPLEWNDCGGPMRGDERVLTALKPYSLRLDVLNHVQLERQGRSREKVKPSQRPVGSHHE